MIAPILPAPTRIKPSEPPVLGRTLAFRNGDYVTLPNGRLATVEGPECLRQAMQRRLATAPGEYATRPDYGAGLRAEVKRPGNRASYERMRARVREQFRQDDRVRDVPTVSVERIAASTQSPSGARISATLVTRAGIVTLKPIEVT